MYNRCCLLWSLSLTLSLAPVVRVQAQLIPDNTLGEENSIVTPVNSLQNRIDGGAIRGSNLFHSFQEFNIDNGQSVYFNNPGAIANILTRVTGANPSSILGKLGVLGNANLFLINPNGIIFGKDASLDISGSFTASTAPSILFDNGWEFNATNPQAPPLLEIDLTPGLQYPRNQLQRITLQDITSQGNLTVGGDLNFMGRNLNLTGQLNAGRDLNLKAQNNLQIRDIPSEDGQSEHSNHPFIASAGNNLLLKGNQTIDILALNHPDSGLFSGNDLVLKSSTPILGDARYFSGGNFRIEDSDGSLGNLKSFNNSIIRASGDVSFDSYIGGSLHILARESVNIKGDVTITDANGGNGLEETITLSSGESLEINGKTQATLDIRAGTTAFTALGVTGSSNFTPGNPNTGKNGSNRNIVIGGNIKIDEKDGLVFLSNQYSADSSLSGGNIEVKGNISTSRKLGNGGKIITDAGGSVLLSDSVWETAAKGIGNGGDININAKSVTVDNSIIRFGILENSSGDGGNLTINAENLTLKANSSFEGDINPGANGKGANVNLNVTDTILLDGASSNVAPTGESTRITVGK